MEIKIMTEVKIDQVMEIDFKFWFIVQTLYHHVHHCTSNKGPSTSGCKSAM